jgi:hypothetical protein
MSIVKKIILLLVLLVPALGRAQSYSIDWYKVAGGGGNSAGTNGGTVYSISGTVGQQDASATMTGAGYSLTGGFWSLISVVQTAGVPNLTINRLGNSVVVSWPNTGNYLLQQNGDLSLQTNWATTSYTVATNSPVGSNSITISPPVGKLFFRLAP